ncbi:MAG: aminotransferase class I/II-fold pyridoxal phosphate-dependent enzyme [Nitrospirota bacterium]
MIPHSRPTIGDEEIKNVEKVLLSHHITCGSMVERFENNMAYYIGVKGGVALSSGTAALHLALLSLGVGEGDEVIIPSYVYLAPLNAITYCRAKPVIVDIDPDTPTLPIDIRHTTLICPEMHFLKIASV